MMKIPPRAKFCCLGKEALTSAYISRIDCVAGEWVRRDYCEKCFDGELTAHTWRGVIPPKEEKATPDVDEKAYQLFLEAVEREGEELYLLALYLERKKRLCKRGGALFEDLLSGRVFEIKPKPLGEKSEKRIKELFG